MNTENEKGNLIFGKVSDNGKCLATEYKVFPGISVVYYNSHTQTGTLKENGINSGNVFEIFHCREGNAVSEKIFAIYLPEIC